MSGDQSQGSQWGSHKPSLWVHPPLTAAPCPFAVAEVIPGGADRWDWLAEGKTSDQLVDVLLEEIGTRVLKERNAFHGKVCASFLCCLFPLGLIGNKYPLGRWENSFYSWCLRYSSSH